MLALAVAGLLLCAAGLPVCAYFGWYRQEIDLADTLDSSADPDVGRLMREKIRECARR